MDLERTMFPRRFVQLQTRSKLKGTGKEEDHVPSPKREDTRKETEKEMSKGKAPKVPVRRESQLNQSALVSRRVQCQKDSARDCWHPPDCSHHESKKWKQIGDTFVPNTQESPEREGRKYRNNCQ